MRSTRLPLLILAALLLAGPTTATAGGRRPLERTMFLVVQRQGGTAKDLPKLKKDLLASAKALPKGFKLRLVTEGRYSWPALSPPHPKRRVKALLDRLDGPVGKATLRRLLSYVAGAWHGSKDAPRHHAVVLCSMAPPPTIKKQLHRLVSKGFTVSFLIRAKLGKSAAKDLRERGAGRVGHGLKFGRSLQRALRKEFTWRRLGKKHKKRRGKAMAASVPKTAPPRGGALVLSGRLGSIRSAKRRSYVKKRFYRSEALVGSKLSMSLRRVRCPGAPCDVAHVRRNLLRRARPLLACLEQNVTVKATELLEVPTKEKPLTPEGRCVAAWSQKIKGGVDAIVLIAVAGAIK